MTAALSRRDRGCICRRVGVPASCLTGVGVRCVTVQRNLADQMRADRRNLYLDGSHAGESVNVVKRSACRVRSFRRSKPVPLNSFGIGLFGWSGNAVRKPFVDCPTRAAVPQRICIGLISYVINSRSAAARNRHLQCLSNLFLSHDLEQCMRLGATLAL